MLGEDDVYSRYEYYACRNLCDPSLDGIAGGEGACPTGYVCVDRTCQLSVLVHAAPLDGRGSVVADSSAAEGEGEPFAGQIAEVI